MYRIILAGWLWLAIVSSALAAEQYVLEAPGNPPVRSSVIIGNRGLTITDENGRRTEYVAFPQADSRDRRYLGYFSSTARQYLQWPINGNGSLYIGRPAADGGVDWTPSRMRVYPAGQPGPVLPGPVLPVRPPVVDAINDQALVPNPPLSPITVEFVNRHSEPLVVKLKELRDNGRLVEFRIAPGEAVEQRIDRDSGATAREAFVTRGPFGEVIQQFRSLPVPARVLYDVSVYAERVTSVTRFLPDKKNPKPPEAKTSPVSLGVFPLPPGTRLRSGDQIDVYGEAMAQKNPGAVR